MIINPDALHTMLSAELREGIRGTRIFPGGLTPKLTYVDTVCLYTEASVLAILEPEPLEDFLMASGIDTTSTDECPL